LTTTNDSAAGRDVRLDWAAWWIALGIKTFIMPAWSKRPTANCPRCDFRNPDVPTHDMDACPCLLCHGFHAATDDLNRFAAMLTQLPDGHLAIRTGQASRLVVLDAESDDRLDPGRPYGIEVLEHWEEWAGDWELLPTLTATTPSGGLHLYYATNQPVASGKRPVPNIETKADGGLVVAPPSPGRRLLPWTPAIAPLQPELLRLVRNARGGSGGGGNGYAGAAGGGDVLPPTEEFLIHGLGWLTGSRNQDAYRLACRLWAQGNDEHDVAGVLKTCWDATSNQRDSSWSEIWRTALSARRRIDDARADELAPYQGFIDNFRRST
jgi:Bifunctional DNA primase/polymerase, N-terminal